jgi:acetylornithine deacetylase/succinyl-diaminopimelate desuccinylase-like protein
MALPASELFVDDTITNLLEREEVRQAFQYFVSHAEEINEEHIRICSIPSAPFNESERAEYLKEKFQNLDLHDARIDEEGNCVALRKGKNLKPLVVISAHLDTVFPIETGFAVERCEEKLFAPGIADDGCGLVALPALAEALQLFDIETKGSLLFVGTVGEEGEGDLRGVRYLFTKSEWAGNSIDAFISFDGAGMERIINAALGSRRYRVCLRGPGGHSWGDFGMVNPVHALGHVIARLSSYPAPKEPRTTFNVGRIEGGSGVNVIATEASMDVDLRSASANELKRVDAFFRRTLLEAVDEENSARRFDAEPLSVDLNLIGSRPNGVTPPEEKIVRLAEDATVVLGYKPMRDISSTDSNLPISLGIPAITLGTGGTAGNIHTLNEWFDTTGREDGLKRALLIVLGLAGVRE